MNAAFVAFAKMQQSREIVTFLPAMGECTSVRILGVFSSIREESRRGFRTVRRKAVGDAFRLDFGVSTSDAPMGTRSANNYSNLD